VDTVSIRSKSNKKEILHNQIKKTRAGGDKPGVNLTLDVKQYDNVAGGSSEMKPPSREVLNNTPRNPIETLTDKTTYPVFVTTNETPSGPSASTIVSILTRETDPQNPDRVKRILEEVTIGPDVTQDQRSVVQGILREYADCFALSMKEVNVIPGTVHKLKIPEGATFRTKIPPRSYNPDQRTFIDNKVNEMLDAGIIHPIHPNEVRFVAQTVLAQKTHEGQGLCIETLKHKVNDQCLMNDIPSEFDLPLRCEPPYPTKPTPLEYRWTI
jgi:hypothetical protein